MEELEQIKEYIDRHLVYLEDSMWAFDPMACCPDDAASIFLAREAAQVLLNGCNEALASIEKENN